MIGIGHSPAEGMQQAFKPMSAPSNLHAWAVTAQQAVEQADAGKVGPKRGSWGPHYLEHPHTT